jgi:hypothetical protein
MTWFVVLAAAVLGIAVGMWLGRWWLAADIRAACAGWRCCESSWAHLTEAHRERSEA